MTATTIPILTFAAVMVLLPTRYLLMSLLAMGAFQDAAVFVIGSMIVNVGWFFLLLTAMRCLVELYPISRQDIVGAGGAMIPLFALFFYGIVAGLLSLALFYEQFLVMPGSAKFAVTSAHLFRPVPEQFRQNIYMAVTLLSMLVVSMYAGRSDRDRILPIVNKMYYSAAAFASFVALWHYANVRFHIPFPGAFFHSDGNHFAWQQGYAGLSRISGSFSEPSGLAQYFAPVLFFVGTHAVLSPNRRARFLTVFSVVVMALSTSTTAYVMLVGFVFFVVVLVVCMALTGRNTRTALTSLAFLVICGVTGLEYFLSNYDHYRELITLTLHKEFSGSYAVRSAANEMAKQIFVSTAGLGIGLGGHRASGLFYNVLAAFGIGGIVCFSLYILAHLRRARHLFAGSTGESRVTTLALSAAGVSGLAVGAVSAGELTTFGYYLPFALLSGLFLANMRVAPVLATSAGHKPTAFDELANPVRSVG